MHCVAGLHNYPQAKFKRLDWYVFDEKLYGAIDLSAVLEISQVFLELQLNNDEL